jgi:hypothetical protein
MKIKPGANMEHASWELLAGIAVVDEEYERAGLDVVVTSCYRPGPWAKTLLHGTERDLKRVHRAGVVDACDFAYPPPDKARAIIAAIRARIGKPAGNFDVLDEGTNANAQAAGVGSQWTGAHLHIEFDPAVPA